MADVTSAPQRWRAVLPVRHDELRCLPVLEAAEEAATDSAAKHAHRCRDHERAILIGEVHTTVREEHAARTAVCHCHVITTAAAGSPAVG